MKDSTNIGAMNFKCTILVPSINYVSSLEGGGVNKMVMVADGKGEGYFEILMSAYFNTNLHISI